MFQASFFNVSHFRIDELNEIIVELISIPFEIQSLSLPFFLYLKWCVNIIIVSKEREKKELEQECVLITLQLFE